MNAPLRVTGREPTHYECLVLAIHATVAQWESTPRVRALIVAGVTAFGEPYNCKPFYPLMWMHHNALHA